MCDSPAGGRWIAAEQVRGREGALEGRLDGGPERGERRRAELAGPLVRPGEMPCDGRVEAVVLGMHGRGVGLDAHERGEPVERASEDGHGPLVHGRPPVPRRRCDEARDDPRGLDGHASAREGLEEGLDGRGGRARGREPPVDRGRGHLHGGDGEDVEHPRRAPRRADAGGEIVERRGRRGEPEEGVRDVELVLGHGLGGREVEVEDGEVTVEGREGARQVEGRLALGLWGERVEVHALGSRGAGAAQAQEVEDLGVAPPLERLEARGRLGVRAEPVEPVVVQLDQRRRGRATVARLGQGMA